MTRTIKPRKPSAGSRILKPGKKSALFIRTALRVHQEATKQTNDSTPPSCRVRVASMAAMQRSLKRNCPDCASSFVVSLTERKPQEKGKTMSKTKKTTPANIIWFEIPADNPDRAKEFYSKLFGWKI